MAIAYLLQFGLTEGSLQDSPLIPSEMAFSFNDVDYDSGRTADGTMHRNKVASKRKIEFSFPPTKDGAALASLLSIVDNEAFYCRYTDPQLNAAVTKKFYAGDRAVPVYNYGLGIYNNLTFNIVEY